MGQGCEEPFDDLPPLHDVVIPDDARDLEGDRLQWLHEQRRARRRRMVERLRSGPRRTGIAAPLVALAMFAVATAGMLAVMLSSRTGPPRQGPTALAAPLAPAGHVGGLLPHLTLTGPRGAVQLRDQRPAALAVVPPECACELALEHAFRQAAGYSVDLVLLGETEQTATLRALAAGTGNGSVMALTGDLDALNSFAPHGLTLVLVRADGVVRSVLRDVGPDLHAELELASLAFDPPTWSGR